MDAFSRIIAHTWTGLVALIAARTALAVANLYGWYPDKILAARIVAANKRLRATIRRLTASFEKPPVVPDAPGLVWKRHRDGWGAIWKARPDYVKAGYRPKFRRVALVRECSPCEKEFIADICTSLQYDMLRFEKPFPPKPKKPSKQKMTPEQQAGMEEILASIRRIIADDDASRAVTS
jgi:hypothetical protein